MITVDEPVTIASPSDSVACNTYLRDALDGVEYWCSVEGWAAPDVRNTLVDRTGADGADQGPHLQGSREVTLTGTLFAPSPAARLAAEQRLAAAVVGPVTVTVGGLQIVGYTSSRPEFASSDCASQWQIVIATGDSVKLSAAGSSILLTQVASTAGLHWGVLHWGPSPGLHWGTGSAGSLQGVATNLGNADAPATIVITGPCVNPSVSNTATGASVRFLTTLAASDVLTIGPGNTATLGGSPWMQALDPVSDLPADFYIAPGDNPIAFFADTLGAGAQAVVSWRDATS